MSSTNGFCHQLLVVLSERIAAIAVLAAVIVLASWYVSTLGDDHVLKTWHRAMTGGSTLPSDKLISQQVASASGESGGGVDPGGCRCSDDTFGENCAGDFYRSIEYLPAAKEALSKCNENVPGASFQARALRTQLERLQSPALCKGNGQDQHRTFTPFRQTMTYRLYKIPEVNNMTSAMRMAITALSDAHVAGYAFQFFPRRQLHAGHVDEKPGADPIHLSHKNPSWQASWSQKFCNKGFGLPVGLSCFFEQVSPCHAEAGIDSTNIEPAAVLQPPLGISVDNVPTPFDRRGVHWYATQLAGYIWRPNERVQHVVESYAKDVGLPHLVGGSNGWRARRAMKDFKGVIGLYVPTSIDCTEFQHNKPAGCVSFPEYMNYVERMRRRYGATTVLLVAENHRAIAETGSEKYKMFKFHYAGARKFAESSDQPEPDGAKAKKSVGIDLAKDIGLKQLKTALDGTPLGTPMPTADLVLTEVLRIELLSRCDMIVAPFGYSTSTLAYQLMAYRKGYWPPYASVDSIPIGRGGMRYEVRKVAVLDDRDRKEVELAQKEAEALAQLRKNGDARGYGCIYGYKGDMRLCPLYKQAKAWDDREEELKVEAAGKIVKLKG